MTNQHYHVTLHDVNDNQEYWREKLVNCLSTTTPNTGGFEVKHGVDIDDLNSQLAAAQLDRDGYRQQYMAANDQTRMANQASEHLVAQRALWLKRASAMLADLREFLIEEGYDEDNAFVRHMVDIYGMDPLSVTYEGTFKLTYDVTFTIEGPSGASFNDLIDDMDQMRAPHINIPSFSKTVNGKLFHFEFVRADDPTDDRWEEL